MAWQRLLGTVCLFIAAFFFLPLGGQCAEQNPEQFLKEFYTWYITRDGEAGGALKVFHGEEIYKYVEKESVEEIKALRNQYATGRLDYFLKESDTMSSMSGVTISVGEVTQMDTYTLVAPVIIIYTYPSGYIRYTHIVVILREKDGVLKIVKCIDIYPEA